MWSQFVTLLAVLLAGAIGLKKDFIVDTLGVMREVFPLNNGDCVQVPELQACEDSWLHHDSGLLYLACSESVISRSKYVPALSIFSSTKEPPSGDYVAIFDTRSTGPIFSRITRIKVEGFHGNRGEGQLNLHGIGVEVTSSSSKPTLKIFLNNHRPSMDSHGNYQDGNKHGANSTVELFETVLGSDSMKHLYTYSNDRRIRTPNFIEPVGDDSFFFTNDHKDKTGFMRNFESLLPRGDITFCNKERCYPSFLKAPAPNGLVRSNHDKRVFFLASSSQGYVRTLKLEEDNSLTLLEKLYTGYPADNLNVDEAGDIWIAAFPKALQTLSHFKDPKNVVSPTTILRIRRNKVAGRQWIVEKMFEDDGNVASGTTIAAYDVRTRKLYLSGLMSPALTVCQMP